MCAVEWIAELKWLYKVSVYMFIPKTADKSLKYFLDLCE